MKRLLTVVALWFALVPCALAQGIDTVKLGPNACASITTGNFNVCIGSAAGASTTTGSVNVSIGYAALYKNQSGSHNTAVGLQSLYWNNGSHNTGIGRDSLFSNTSGLWNTALGVDSCPGNSTGSYNTCIGGESGYGGIPPGGGAAPDQDLTGSYNTRLGYRASAKDGMQALNNSTAIGAYAKVNKDNQVSIGDTNVTEFVFGGVTMTKAQLQALLATLP